jgi:2-oxoglutarate ferredoxin oxidoreductase subunit alpha
VLAPSSVQEAVNLVILAFELAEKYLTPVMVIGDGMIGQMMEPVEFPIEGVGPPLDPGDWALTGARGRDKRIINSLHLNPEICNRVNMDLKAKYDRIKEHEKRWELYNCDEPYDLLVCAFGMMSRICKTAIDELAAEGYRIGLFRPITVWPFPYAACKQAMQKAKRTLVLEMNMGQMVEDVQIAGQGTREIDFFGTAGGKVLSPDESKEKMLYSLEQAGVGKPRAKSKPNQKAAKRTTKKRKTR